MGFKQVADMECDTTIQIGGKDKKSGKANPTTLTGYYIGTKQVASAKSKTGFSAVHVFQTPKGNVGVWGKTNLDQKMKAATAGALTRITFVGMVETKNNPMYKYSVEVDQEDTIEVGTNDDSGASADDASDGGYAAADMDYAAADDLDPPLDADEAPLDEVPAPRAARPTRPAQAPTSASAAEVQRQLRSRAARN